VVWGLVGGLEKYLQGYCMTLIVEAGSAKCTYEGFWIRNPMCVAPVSSVVCGIVISVKWINYTVLYYDIDL
jgi:hypothetical protein